MHKKLLTALSIIAISTLAITAHADSTQSITLKNELPSTPVFNASFISYTYSYPGNNHTVGRGSVNEQSFDLQSTDLKSQLVAPAYLPADYTNLVITHIKISSGSGTVKDPTNTVSLNCTNARPVDDEANITVVLTENSCVTY